MTCGDAAPSTTDGVGIGWDAGKRGLGDEHDALGAAGRLLGVEEPLALGAGLEGELTALERVGQHVFAQGFGDGVHGPRR